MSGAATTGDDGRTPSPLVRATLALEKTTAVDKLVSALGPAADAVVADPARRRALQAQLLGHALHPTLTDVPLGAWLSAAVLDLTGGRQDRPAATRLIGFGVLSAVPTAVAGMAEWADVEGAGPKRVGAVHATANSVALGLYAGSWFARRRQRHGLGIALSMGAAAAAGVGGFLGGHLAIASKVSTSDPAFENEP